MSDIERREIYTLRTKLDAAIQERDEARDAAREMYLDVVQYDPCDHCPGWKKQWPWVTGEK
jgi:hypothetical protein